MILLDTHALVWWVSDEAKLSSKARSAIATAIKQDGIAISAISMWELSMLLKKGRLQVTIDPDVWLDRLEQTQGLFILSVDARIARNSVLLPGEFHEDPADRLIVTTARIHRLPLVTADNKIRKYPHVVTVW